MSFNTVGHGYFFASVVGFMLQQGVLFVIPVVIQRTATKIKAPTLYPTDKEIKALDLTEEKVGNYMRAQRVHQNNMEFLAQFMPIYICSGLVDPMLTAKFGAAILVLRTVNAYGYWESADSNFRKIGALFHLPELYLVGNLAVHAYELINQ